MSTARRARVTVAYATVKIVDPATGRPTVAGFYEGAVFPLEADPENVASLVRREYAEWLDSDDLRTVEKQEGDAEEAQKEAAEKRAVESEAAVKKAEDGADAAAKAAEPKDADEPDDSVDDAPRRPADSAKKAAWVDYAVAVRDDGVSEGEARSAAEAMTKEDLITVHG